MTSADVDRKRRLLEEAYPCMAGLGERWRCPPAGKPCANCDRVVKAMALLVATITTTSASRSGKTRR